MKLNLNNFGKKLKFSKRSKKEKILTEKEIFVDIIDKLNACWVKSNKLYEMFKISNLEYEEDYYQLIENLLVAKYGPWKTEIALWYVFGRIDEEGNILPLILQDKDDKKEEEIILKNSTELWNFILKVEEKRKTEE